MKKIKLWISDIDGTLMNYDGSYTKEMEDVINKINKSEVKMVLATGRMFMGAKFAADNFNIKTPIVCYQGAVVRTEDKVLWQSPVKNEIAREIIDYLRKKQIHTHIYNDDVLYIENENKRIMDEYCNGRGTIYKLIKSFDDIKLNSVAKILAVIEDSALMNQTKEELSKLYKNKLTIVQSSSKYLEINNIGASKGSALNFLKKYWNLSDDEVLASGDQDNDVEMLKNAGIRVCVGNHSKALAQVAQYKCESVNSNELVDIVERLVLCE